MCKECASREKNRVRGKHGRERGSKVIGGGDGQDGRSWSLTVGSPRPIENPPVALAPENSNMSASGWV